MTPADEGMAGLVGAELDQARAQEANRLWGEAINGPHVAIIAARLAREGWTPPDPLEAEIRAILGPHAGGKSGLNTTCLTFHAETTVNYIRKALERGIQIGREKPHG